MSESTDGWVPPGDAGRDVILRATDSARVQEKMDVVTPDLLEQRVAVERRRYIKYMCWITSIFFVVSALLLSVGVVVVAESRRAIKDVSNIEDKTDRALLDIGNMASDVRKVDKRAEDISNNLLKEQATYRSDRADLQSDLRRLSGWYDAKYASLSNVLSDAAVSSRRFDEIEHMEDARAKRFGEIEEWFQRERLALSMKTRGSTVPPVDDKGIRKLRPQVSRSTAPPDAVSTGAGRERISYGDGSEYAGEVRNGMKHGTGTFVFANGDRYVGEFDNDVREGQGVYYYASGARYEGAFRNGKRHGPGTYVYTNGDQFTGTFVAGKKEGPGIYLYADDTRVTGLWKDDVLVNQEL